MEIPAGGGKLIVDEMRWETPAKKLDRLAIRVASALATNLNVKIHRAGVAGHHRRNGVVMTGYQKTEYGNAVFHCYGIRFGKTPH